MITRADERGLHTKDGNLISADLMVWAAGIKAPDFMHEIAGLETNRINQLVVEPTLQTTRDANIFAFGDCAACPRPEGGFIPPRGQAAPQMALFTANNIIAQMKGRPLKSFVYRDRGSLVSLSGYTTLGSIMGHLRVQCAEYADAGNISCVGINDLDAAQVVVLRLAQGGRQRIALINHDLSYRYARLRERGYKSVLHVRDLSYQQVAYASELSAAAGKAAMETLLAAKERPDAVFAVADSLAAGALRAIAQAGLRMPKDIAVIGFDGTELAEMVSPQLTTVEQPSRDIGRTAVTLLLKKIDNPTAEAERVMMDWRVIIRASA